MKIETYGDQRVRTQVANQPLARTQQVADTSTPIARGVQQLARGMDVARQRYDETVAEDALIKFERDKNDLFFNPESGYFNKQGRDAYDGAEDTTAALAKLQRQYADSIKSPEARKAFDRAAQANISRALNDVNRHASRGLDMYEAATMQTRAENALESASLYWNNDKEANLQLAIGREAILNATERQGLGPEVLQDRLNDYESKFAASRVTAAVKQDLGQANALFEKLGKRMSPADRQLVSNELSKANFDRQAIDTTQAIIGDGNRTMAEMAQELDTLPGNTPEELAFKSEVKRQVKDQYSLNKLMREDALDQMYQNYGKQVQDGDIKASDIPAAAWDSMTLKQRESIHKLERLVATGDKVTTDDYLLTDILMLPKDELAKVDPTWYFDRIGGADRDKLRSAVMAARKGDTSAVTEVTTDATRLSNTMTQIFGKTKAKLSKNEVEQYNALSRAIQSRVSQVEAGGTKLGPDEKDKLYSEFARNVVIERNWWFNTERDITDFEPEQVDMATQYLRALNVPINSVNLINFIRNNPTKFE